MDIVNLKTWASQPDVCRCCLATNGSYDLLAVYLNEAGEKQVYSELLLSCFGISLSSLSSLSSRGGLVCAACSRRLLDAETFRRQVLRAELQYVTYINAIQETAKTIDEEECSSSPNDQYDQPDTLVAEPSHRSALNENIDNSSETEFERSNLDKIPTRRKNTKDTTSKVIDYENDGEAVNVPLPGSKPAIKLLSERKRIKTTCETILRDTTACPFRHHRSWFQCFFCPQSFLDISSLRTHYQQTHTNLEEQVKNLKRYPRSLQIDITEFKCKLCDSPLTTVEDMRAHLIEEHKLIIYKECIADYKVNNSPYSCHICGKEFHVFRTLTTHLNEHYANYICDVCGKSFINSKRLKVHNRTHQSGIFPCTLCGKVLKTKTAKVNHMETHSKRVIRCQICSKPMKHYNDRIKHMSEEHNITHKFQCPICAREYNIKHYLATHIRQTHGHKNKKCGECGMAFITNHGLKKHMQRHSGLKAHSCEVCSKAYARRHSLREHMRVHDT